MSDEPDGGIPPLGGGALGGGALGGGALGGMPPLGGGLLGGGVPPPIVPPGLLISKPPLACTFCQAP